MQLGGAQGRVEAVTAEEKLHTDIGNVAVVRPTPVVERTETANSAAPARSPPSALGGRDSGHETKFPERGVRHPYQVYTDGPFDRGLSSQTAAS